MKKLLISTALVFLLSGCTSIYNQVDNQDNQTDSQANKIENPDEPDKMPEKIPPNQTKKEGDVLNLSNQGLEKIPSSVFEQRDLKELDVSGNQLTGAMQAEIRQLQNLRVLNASNNLMTGVPAEIGQLENLETLDLSNNQLTGLPYELGNLKNLKTFNISGNDYSELDLEIISESLPGKVIIIK